jgi:hypothetical protein
VNIKALDSEGNLLEDGTTVQEKELVKSSTPYDHKVIGIVSNNYSDFSSTGHNRIDPADHPMPVALNGRVPVKIAATSTSILPGDYITTSGEPGKAMRAIQAGQVIGKALEAWDPSSGKSTVLVYVEQGYYAGPGLQESSSYVTNGSDASFASLNVSGQTTLATLTVTGDAVIQGELTVATAHVTGRLLVDGHIVSGGDAPTIATAAGQVLGSSVDGTDTAGTVTLNGDAASHAGALATVTFNQAYDKVPRIVLTPTNADALSIKVYLQKTATGFTIVTDDTPIAGKSYQFDYIIVE